MLIRQLLTTTSEDSVILFTYYVRYHVRCYVRYYYVRYYVRYFERYYSSLFIPPNCNLKGENREILLTQTSTTTSYLI